MFCAESAGRGPAIDRTQDIVLVVDYHSGNLQFRSLDRVTGEEQVLKKRTCASGIKEVWKQHGTQQSREVDALWG